MTKPVTIPNTFATATTAIPLSNLDADFSTVATALNDANTYSNYAPDTGSANAYVVTLSGVSTTYSAGLRIQFKAGNANTTASTLNVNGGGAKNITYQDATAIASGTIAANSIVDVMYDGTQFLLMNDPAGATGGDVVGPSSATDNAIVRFDGTTGKLVQNSVVTIADSTGDISGVGQLNATTLDATNIEVTNIKAKDGTAAASIADSTGVISITSNPVLSGGTANGVLYLNGSKVATSGSALTFDGTSQFKVNIASATSGASLVSSGNFGVRLGANSTNGALIEGVDNTGASSYQPLYIGGSDLRFTNSGTEQMRLTSTGLGIGTSSPAYKLHVNKGTSGDLANFTDGVAQSLVLKTNATSFVLDESNGGNIVFAQSNVEKMRLDSSGNLGLGVTPSTWSGYTAFQILRGSMNADNSAVAFSHNAYFNSGWKYIASSVQATQYDQYLGQHRWFNAPSGTAGDPITFTQAMTLDASGNLGVGTSSPTRRLDVYGSGQFKDASGIGTTIWSEAVSGAGGTGTNTNHPFAILTNGTERARITSGGDLLVGRTDTDASERLSVYNGSSANFVMNLRNDAATQNWIRFAKSGGTAIGSITGDGTNTAYNTSSDYRLKDNPQPLTNSGAFIDALQPKTWNWKETGKKGVGFIAHEVQEVSPGSVVGEKDAVDEEGKPIMQAMEYGSAEFIANIIAELQSLRQRVALLEGN